MDDSVFEDIVKIWTGELPHDENLTSALENAFHLIEAKYRLRFTVILGDGSVERISPLFLALLASHHVFEMKNCGDKEVR